MSENEETGGVNSDTRMMSNNADSLNTDGNAKGKRSISYYY